MTSRRRNQSPQTWPCYAGHAGVAGLALFLCLAALGQAQPLGPNAEPTIDSGVTAESESESDVKLLSDRILAWHVIGGSSKNFRARHVGWGLPNSNWQSYIRLMVRPQLEAGVRRILLHNPFGRTDLEQSMAFDQYLEAQASGDTWLTQGFVEAWSPVIAGHYTDGQPVEVICYLGSMDADLEMNALVQTPDDWQQRARRSVEPALQAGMSIGFDSANDYALDSLEFRMIREIAETGARIYLEPRPDANRPHLFRFNVISTQEHWFRSDPDKHGKSGAGHKAANDQLTGEIVLLIKGQNDTPVRQQRTRELFTTTDYAVAVVLNKQINRNHNAAQWVGLDQPPATPQPPTAP